MRFSDFHPEIPDFETLAAAHAGLDERLGRASDPEECLAVIADWDALRRRVEDWSEWVYLRAQQDTRDPERKADLERRDELMPKATELANALRRRLLAHPRRPDLEARLGGQAFALWEADVLAYSPAIETEKVEESRLETAYVELLASASFEYGGESLNLSGLARYRDHADRRVREETERLRWQWFAAHGQELDELFDRLVKLRNAMARKLGFEDYRGLGYARMRRTDYGPAEVARFREAVRSELGPLCAELRERQGRMLGAEPLMYWDEGVYNPAGNPAPLGDHDWMLDRAREMFDAMGPGLGTFFRMMADQGLLDLKNREGKAGGGFCTAFPAQGLPFIFANFNGTMGDVEVFTHEAGHAYQDWSSRSQPLVDYLWPTMDACEIHSMSLEFLTWPHMDRFFGSGADRFRRAHLTRSLLFLPYGCAVDHFQHLVYERPEAGPGERREMWREMERRYLPARRYGDLPHASAGGMWQLQRHIYLSPFYYIDYVLAGTCALQFWTRSRRDPAAALRDYEALCARGGSLPFRALARSAGLESPFEEGCLATVARHARAALEGDPS